MYLKLKKLLIDAGFGNPEVLVYQNLLKAPAENRWELVKRTGLNKSQVYRAFDRLLTLKMVELNENGIFAGSLNGLIGKLKSDQNLKQKLINDLKQLNPFLSIYEDSCNSFEVLDNKEDILEKYMMMSELKYNVNLDFGDLENFVNVLGGLDPIFKFRDNRYRKNSNNVAICTTEGPFTYCMMRKEDLRKYKSNIELKNMNLEGLWVIFSDDNDFVMFNYFKDKENPYSVIVKSRPVADFQRFTFSIFSRN